MKKILFMLLAVLPLMISSCSKDDDEKVVDLNARFIGTWERTVDGAQGTELKSASFTFKANRDGIREYIYANGRVETAMIISWTIDDQKNRLHLKFDDQEEEFYTYRFDNNYKTLYLTGSANEFVYRKK